MISTKKHQRMQKNTIVTPKPSKKTGFTQWNVRNRELIAGHYEAFIAAGGVVDVLASDFQAPPKAYMPGLVSDF